MYEYRQNGGFIPTPHVKAEEKPNQPVKVTVEEKFDEAGRLVSRTTTTEYVKAPLSPSYFTSTINTGSSGSSTGPHLQFKNM